MKRKMLAVSALAAVPLVQLTVVNGLALPGGGTPDLVLLCVVALGLTGGPAPGLIAGFCAGLALDLAPPASQIVGQYALVLCRVGYGSGRRRFTLRHSAAAAIAAAAVVAALGEALAAAITLTMDTPEVTWATVAQVLPASVLYDLALGPFVLLCWVRAAVALGVSFDPRDDSPALETGGSAAQATVAGGAARPGRPRPRQAGQRLALGGDSRAAACGRWLVGDVAEAAPTVGAIGWLAGPVRSRRARREQARLTAMATGASQRRGAFWVGRRPPGLVPVMPPAPARPGRLVRLRPGSGVPGTAAAPGPARAGRRAAQAVAAGRPGGSRARPRPARPRAARGGRARRERAEPAEHPVRHRDLAGDGPDGRAGRPQDRVRDREPAGGRAGGGAPGAEDRVRDREPARGRPGCGAPGSSGRCNSEPPGAEDRVRGAERGTGRTVPCQPGRRRPARCARSPPGYPAIRVRSQAGRIGGGPGRSRVTGRPGRADGLMRNAP